MTRQGWNPRGVYGHYLRTQAIHEVRDQLNAPSPVRPKAYEWAPRVITR